MSEILWGIVERALTQRKVVAATTSFYYDGQRRAALVVGQSIGE